MINYFPWKEEYKFGFAEIDKQHEYFVSLLNKLYDAVISLAAREILAGILDELATYASDHFATEEKYFDQFQYSDAEVHKEEHRKLKETVLKFKEDFGANKKDISFDLLDFLESWLVDHLNQMDQKYVQCFKDNGLK